MKDLDILAVMSPGAYTAWFKVKDLRTNIVTSTEFKIQISTSTTQDGWCYVKKGKTARSE